MNNILVSGHIGVEITAKIDRFPVKYTPIDYEFYGVNSTIAGVGYNIAKAIKTLGGNPTFFSVIGNDIYKDIIKNEIENIGINNEYVLPIMENTSQSVILYNENKRKIILDLKNVQEIKYPVEKVDEVISTVDMAILCNINYSRELLKKIKGYGKTIATDVHVLNDIDDKYNKDFLAYSDILFLSNEKILGKEEVFLKKIAVAYNNKIIVIGLGENGVLMYVREGSKTEHYPAVKTRNIVNTIGAGDALFSSFIYFYNKTKDAYYSIEKAIIFASYKIGEKGAAQGFLPEDELLKIKI
ncbi:MAG: carbohydrate kinase family protein [Treponema sp.]|jgi:ribokinase|nr:carbohydrate kinase family protein [Treponema sp.]